jgi:hypothetical protein
MVPLEALRSRFDVADEPNVGQAGNEDRRVVGRSDGSRLADKGLWPRNRSLHVHFHRLLKRF